MHNNKYEKILQCLFGHDTMTISSLFSHVMWYYHGIFQKYITKIFESTYFQQGCIQLIKSDSKDIVTKKYF